MQSLIAAERLPLLLSLRDLRQALKALEGSADAAAILAEICALHGALGRNAMLSADEVDEELRRAGMLDSRNEMIARLEALKAQYLPFIERSDELQREIDALTEAQDEAEKQAAAIKKQAYDFFERFQDELELDWALSPDEWD